MKILCKDLCNHANKFMNLTNQVVSLESSGGLVIVEVRQSAITLFVSFQCEDPLFLFGGS